MLYVCVFILLTLSSSREFALMLNEPYTLAMPFDLPDFVPTTYANLLIQVVFRSIQVGPRVLAPLYKSLISIIANVAPYAKNLTKDSSEALFKLVKRFSTVEFLRESESNCKILSNSLEAVNYVLQYHDEGIEEFLITLIQYRETFSFIDTVKLAEEAPTEPQTEESLDKPEEEKKMVSIPLEQEEKEKSDAPVEKDLSAEPEFLSEEWETKWKESLNLPNIHQAIKYVDEKARNYLQQNPSADNHIDADQFLQKSSLKGLLPNLVKIMVTTYNGHASIDSWIVAYIWGTSYMKLHEGGIFNPETIKMIMVDQSQAK